MKKLKRLDNKGFTLVELIIVIAIIAILAAVIAPQYIKYVERSKQSTDVNTAAAIEQAVNVMCADGSIADYGTGPYTVTWTTADGALGGTAGKAASGDALATLTSTLGGSSSKIAKATSKNALAVTTVTYSIAFGSDGTPTVTVKNGDAVLDYKAWKQA